VPKQILWCKRCGYEEELRSQDMPPRFVSAEIDGQFFYGLIAEEE
jgi:hypothetical protein